MYGRDLYPHIIVAIYNEKTLKLNISKLLRCYLCCYLLSSSFILICTLLMLKMICSCTQFVTCYCTTVLYISQYCTLAHRDIGTYNMLLLHVDTLMLILYVTVSLFAQVSIATRTYRCTKSIFIYS